MDMAEEIRSLFAEKRELRDEIKELQEEIRTLRADLEQSRVQLAGCGLAALGYGGDCKQGDYGWSASFADVMRLRAEVTELRKIAEALDAHMLAKDSGRWESVENAWESWRSRTNGGER